MSVASTIDVRALHNDIQEIGFMVQEIEAEVSARLTSYEGSRRYVREFNRLQEVADREMLEGDLWAASVTANLAKVKWRALRTPPGYPPRYLEPLTQD